MKKLLQIVFGLILILVLAYLSFLEVSSKIKDDLLEKTKTRLSDKGIVDVEASIDGTGLGMSRTLVLTGTAGTEKEKKRVSSLVEGLEGVGAVINNLVIKPRLYYVVPTAIAVENTKTVVPLSIAPVTPIKISEVVMEITESSMEEVSSVAEIEKVLKVKPLESPIAIPKVPEVVQNTIEVPTVIEAIEVPMVVNVKKLIDLEKNKTENIEIKGVK